MFRSLVQCFYGAMMMVAMTAQADPAPPEFKYIGCVEADPSSFIVNISFFVPFTAAQCRNACDPSSTYAALGAGCHCSEPQSQTPIAFNVVDESKCSIWCIEGDKSAGRCGGPATHGGRQLYNLYKREH